MESSNYPADWPRCPSCGDFALDGHITCGRVACDEQGWRDLSKRITADDITKAASIYEKGEA